MNRKVLAFIGCFIFSVQPCFAAKHKALASSADHLAQDLQGFQSSIAKLEDSNRQLAAYNHDLKEHIGQANSQVESLNRTKIVLEKDSQFYESKTKDKSSQLNSLAIQLDENKNRVEQIEREITLKDSEIKKRLAHQQVIWEELANSQNGTRSSTDDLVSLSSVGILNEKADLVQRLKLKEQYLNDLQKQLDEEFLLSAEPALSVPKFTSERERLGKDLLALNQIQGQTITKSLDDGKLRKQLNFEVNDMSKRRLELANLLQMLQDQYDGNEKIGKNSAEEKKLKDSILVLEKDNKFLKRQAADLRFEMVDFDKRRTQLERLVNSVKK